MDNNITKNATNATVAYRTPAVLDSWWLAPLASIATFTLGLILFVFGRCLRDRCCGNSTDAVGDSYVAVDESNYATSGVNNNDATVNNNNKRSTKPFDASNAPRKSSSSRNAGDREEEMSNSTLASTATASSFASGANNQNLSMSMSHNNTSTAFIQQHLSSRHLISGQSAQGQNASGGAVAVEAPPPNPSSSAAAAVRTASEVENSEHSVSHDTAVSVAAETSAAE